MPKNFLTCGAPAPTALCTSGYAYGVSAFYSLSYLHLAKACFPAGPRFTPNPQTCISLGNIVGFSRVQ